MLIYDSDKEIFELVLSWLVYQVRFEVRQISFWVRLYGVCLIDQNFPWIIKISLPLTWVRLSGKIASFFYK